MLRIEIEQTVNFKNWTIAKQSRTHVFNLPFRYPWPVVT